MAQVWIQTSAVAAAFFRLIPMGRGGGIRWVLPPRSIGPVIQ